MSTPSGSSADLDGVDLGGVDPVEVLDQRLEAGVRRVAEVEELEEVDPAALAAGHLVEVVLHLGGEGEVGVLGEVLLEQAAPPGRLTQSGTSACPFFQT